MCNTTRFLLMAILTSCISVYSQWTQLNSPSVNTLYTVHFINAQTGFIAGSTNGIVIRTTDGGISWIFTNTGTTSTFYDIHFFDSQTGVVAGSSKQVIKTTNSGLNWSIKTSGSGTIYNISFPSTIGYTAGSSGYIDKSTDYGNNWTQLIAPTTLLRGAYFATGTIGWFCGSSGTLWKTTDGCVSWLPLNQSASYSFEKIKFHSTTTGYVIGTNGTILRSTNSGTNWSPVSSGTTSSLYDMFWLNSITGWIVGSNGKIIKTTDNGLTWLLQSSPVTGTLYGIYMADASTGYIVGSSGVLLKTTNGGGVPVIPCFTKVLNDPTVQDNAWSQGNAWGDYDNDGDQDLLVTPFNDNCWSCIYPLMLYRNDGTTFTKIITGPIANEINRTGGAAWGDYDNDGKLDLFVTSLNPDGNGSNNLLFHNEGNGIFTKITNGIIVNDGGNSCACGWLDYDKDGWLDLFVVNIFAENDFLYHNNGNGTFTKITTGSIVNDNLWGRNCSFGDYDNDGWTDIFVPCYQGQSDRLYHNVNGIYVLTSGVLPTDNGWAAGSAFGDYDNDGWLDLIVANHNSSNYLYHNNGNGTFSKIINGPGLDSGPISFGPVWIDYDNDSKLDLFVTNFGNSCFLYKNQGNGNLNRINGENITADYIYGIGSSTSDFNSDGKSDIFIDNNGSLQPQNDLLFKNTCITGNYIGIKLHGCNFNKFGIGARIIVYSGGIKQIREVQGSSGYLSQNMLWQLFGLGNATEIDSVIVKWTTGNVQKLTDLPVNTYMTIDECLIGIISYNNDIPTEYILMQNYPNPFNPITTIRYGIPTVSNVKLLIYDTNGRLIKKLIDNYQYAGYYDVEFDGNSLSSGIYYYSLETDNNKQVKKMILVK